MGGNPPTTGAGSLLLGQHDLVAGNRTGNVDAGLNQVGLFSEAPKKSMCHPHRCMEFLEDGKDSPKQRSQPRCHETFALNKKSNLAAVPKRKNSQGPH